MSAWGGGASLAVAEEGRREAGRLEPSSSCPPPGDAGELEQIDYIDSSLNGEEEEEEEDLLGEEEVTGPPPAGRASKAWTGPPGTASHEVRQPPRGPSPLALGEAARSLFWEAMESTPRALGACGRGAGGKSAPPH